MAVEILDGSIDPVDPVRTKRSYAIFDTLRFRDRNGIERSVMKVCTGGEVSDLVRRGGTGRYYLSSGGGQTGIHGVRLDDGTEAYAHYNNMEFIVLLGIMASLVALVIGIATGEMMTTPLVLGVLLVGVYFFLRGIRLAGKRQYDTDAVRS